MTHAVFDDLPLAQRLLLLAWRRGHARGAEDSCSEAAWRIAAGDGPGGRCADLFRRLADRVAVHARRPLALAPPHARRLTQDERCLLELVSACQSDRTDLAVGLARWLVRSPEHVAVLAIAAGLGYAMEGAGLTLSVASREPRAAHRFSPARPGAVPGAVA